MLLIQLLLSFWVAKDEPDRWLGNFQRICVPRPFRYML
jgi:hypothetical protein